jgi:hypothetical protein
LREGWVQEVQRDVMALGGAVFYARVLGRALVGPYWDLAVPLLVVGVGLLVGYPLLRNTDLYLTRGLLVAVLVSRHYDDLVFAVFATITYVLMTVFAVRLGRSVPAVVRGIALGAAASAGGWVIADLAD